MIYRTIDWFNDDGLFVGPHSSIVSPWRPIAKRSVFWPACQFEKKCEIFGPQETKTSQSCTRRSSQHSKFLVVVISSVVQSTVQTPTLLTVSNWIWSGRSSGGAPSPSELLGPLQIKPHYQNVPVFKTDEELVFKFDFGLRRSLETLSIPPVSDLAWKRFILVASVFEMYIWTCVGWVRWPYTWLQSSQDQTSRCLCDNLSLTTLGQFRCR